MKDTHLSEYGGNVWSSSLQAGVVVLSEPFLLS
jgi:hypothetical protein